MSAIEAAWHFAACAFWGFTAAWFLRGEGPTRGTVAIAVIAVIRVVASALLVARESPKEMPR